jgi:uncharacterized protein (UPF0332 family)
MKQEEVELLIRYRLEQAQTALDDARYLLEGRRSPQGIINRSYDAMFYAAVALLQKIGKIPSKHAGVISIFDVEFVQKKIFSKQLSKDFHRAFELRQISDYRSTKTPAKDQAEEVLKKAAVFVQTVKEYLQQ